MNFMTIIVVLVIFSLSPVMAGEPLLIVEEGTPEAEELRKAHEADLKGAMESPEEAAAHQKDLEKEKARQAKEDVKGEEGDKDEAN